MHHTGKVVAVQRYAGNEASQPHSYYKYLNSLVLKGLSKCPSDSSALVPKYVYMSASVPNVQQCRVVEEVSKKLH